jgi:predicted dehydrogenase
MPWFWQAQRQGGGVLSDMTCHSVEVGRFLLSRPGAPRTDLKLVSASATVGNLKWTRPEYVTRLKNMMGADVDYACGRPRILRAARSPSAMPRDMK